MARGTEIVAIIAQEVFSTNDYQFATVKPIASIENDRLQPVRPGDFPNRDLCWWMVRNIAPIREVIPGRILVGQCQDADRYDPQDLDKDKYQLDGGTVRLGGPRSIIEIIAADCGPDPRQLINQNHVATLDHPPTSMVLAKLGDKVYGPFKTEFDQHGRRFHITLEKSKSFDYSHMFDLAKIRSDPGYISIKQISFSTDARPLSNYPPAKPGAFDRWPLKGACSRSLKKRIHGIGNKLAPSQTMGYHAAARSFCVRSHYLLKRIHQIPEMSNFFCPPAEPGVFPG